jgi:hypothetical protein
VRRPDAAKPYYRRIVDNVKIETKPLLQALRPQQQIQANDRGNSDRKSPKEWIRAYVERRRAIGDIPNTITQFSREIASAMRDDDDCERSLKCRSIENRLRDWDLWPVGQAK